MTVEKVDYYDGQQVINNNRLIANLNGNKYICSDGDYDIGSFYNSMGALTTDLHTRRYNSCEDVESAILNHTLLAAGGNHGIPIYEDVRNTYPYLKCKISLEYCNIDNDNGGIKIAISANDKIIDVSDEFNVSAKGSNVVPFHYGT